MANQHWNIILSVCTYMHIKSIMEKNNNSRYYIALNFLGNFKSLVSKAFVKSVLKYEPLKQILHVSFLSIFSFTEILEDSRHENWPNATKMCWMVDILAVILYFNQKELQFKQKT